MATGVNMKYKRYSALQYCDGKSHVAPHPSMIKILEKDGFIVRGRGAYLLTDLARRWMRDMEAQFPMGRLAA